MAEEKTPFAAGKVSLSGMTSSVLNPKSEDERRKIGQEIKRRADRLNGKKRERPILPILTLVLLLVAGVALMAKTPVAPAKPDLKLVGQNTAVFGRNFRLVLKANPEVDKVILLMSQDQQKFQRYEGQLVNHGVGENTWQVLAEELAAGHYSYKCYLKNTLKDQFIFVSGNCTVEKFNK